MVWGKATEPEGPAEFREERPGRAATVGLPLRQSPMETPVTTGMGCPGTRTPGCASTNRRSSHPRLGADRLWFFRSGIHAASGDEGSGTGRAIPSGQSTPSGQLADSHFTALSRRPTVMSEPSTNRRYITPELNSSVATRLVESPRAVAYTSMSLIRC